MNWGIVQMGEIDIDIESYTGADIPKQTVAYY